MSEGEYLQVGEFESIKALNVFLQQVGADRIMDVKKVDGGYYLVVYKEGAK